MTAPAFAMCACTHTQRRHLDNEGACEARECYCTAFHQVGGLIPQDVAPAAPNAPTPAVPRPAAPVARPRPPQRPAPATAPPDPQPARRTLIDQARRSKSNRTRQLGAKIETLLEQLAIRLQSESQEAIAKQLVTDLERKLAAARVELRRLSRPDLPPAPEGRIPCPEPGCEETFPTTQAMGGHRSSAHRDRSGGESS